MWTWEQWVGRHGTETITEERDIYRDCYPREFVEPPSVELLLAEHEGSHMLASPELTNDPNTYGDALHIINLVLEIFGSCDIVRDDLSSFASIPVKKANWRFLPPGRYPWDRVKAHLKEMLKERHERFTEVIHKRHEIMAERKPDEVYIGEGGFDRYVAYVFSELRLVVLECTAADNAIYVFGSDWKKFSRLTKREVLKSSLMAARIVHCRGWVAKLDDVLMRARRAA